MGVLGGGMLLESLFGLGVSFFWLGNLLCVCVFGSLFLGMIY